MMATSSSLVISAVFLAVLVAEAVSVPQGRIFDGQDGVTGQFPYAVSVRLDKAHKCGGTLISNRHILTAAHPVTEKNQAVAASRLSVRVGSISIIAGGRIINVGRVIVHPLYSDIMHNIAILELEETIDFSTTVAAIAVAKSSDPKPAVGTQMRVAGWGQNAEDSSIPRIQHDVYPVADEASCLDAYPEHDESTLCLTHRPKSGQCIGDAGNGAVADNKLMGLSSFVVGTCGSRYPDVYTNVGYYSSWIESVIQ